MQTELSPADKISAVVSAVKDLLLYKNMKYGNSGLKPMSVFSKTDPVEKLLARADDKISRIKNSEELRKSDVVDLIGYCVLICAAKGWDNFDDQKD